jgi:hypothetical protein
MRRRKSKEQQPVQTPAVTIRFYDEDTELLDWLKQFAGRHNMTSVIKLACYMLSGIQPEAGLLALLPEVQSHQIEPSRVQEPPAQVPYEETNDALAAVMQELSALREEIAQQRTEPSAQPERPPDTRSRRQQPMPPTLPEEHWPSDTPYREPAPVASSGLDMSGSRRRRDRPPDTPHRNQPVEAAFDADEARRKLVASINAYGKGLREGY